MIERINELRAQGMSLQSACRIIKGEQLRQQLQEAADIEALRAILSTIIDEMYPKREGGH